MYERVSEDSDIASVDDDGNITGISSGETNIIVKYKVDDLIYTNSCSVTVLNVEEEEIVATSISFIQDTVSLKIGESTILQIEFSPDNAEIQEYTFSSDDSSIVSIDSNGKIMAHKAGSTIVRVTSGDLSDILGVTVTENKPTIISPTSIALVGLSNSLSVGTTAQVNYNILPDNNTFE